MSHGKLITIATLALTLGLGKFAGAVTINVPGDFATIQAAIDADPLFVDPDGADNTVGTDDDDLRLQAGSPYIDAGDRSALPGDVVTDLDGEHPAKIICVRAGALGADNGSSWTDAFVFLQDGLDAATCGDEIWVAQGTYHPDDGMSVAMGDREATFQLKNGVALYGGFDGTETMLSQRDPATNVTTLSGDLLGDDDGFTNNTENSYD